MRAGSQPANFHVVEARKRIELSSEFYLSFIHETNMRSECVAGQMDMCPLLVNTFADSGLHVYQSYLYGQRRENMCFSGHVCLGHEQGMFMFKCKKVLTL